MTGGAGYAVSVDGEMSLGSKFRVFSWHVAIQQRQVVIKRECYLVTVVFAASQVTAVLVDNFNSI
jgi:hypothetical protein